MLALANRCFWICSDCTKLHIELLILKEIFLKNDFTETFINKCFKRFMNSIHAIRETTLAVEKKLLVLVLPYLCLKSLQS